MGNIRKNLEVKCSRLTGKREAYQHTLKELDRDRWIMSFCFFGALPFVLFELSSALRENNWYVLIIVVVVGYLFFVTFNHINAYHNHLKTSINDIEAEIRLTKLERGRQRH